MKAKEIKRDFVVGLFLTVTAIAIFALGILLINKAFGISHEKEEDNIVLNAAVMSEKDQNERISIYIDPETKVQYIIYRDVIAESTNMIPRLNPDGSLYIAE